MPKYRKDIPASRKNEKKTLKKNEPPQNNILTAKIQRAFSNSTRIVEDGEILSILINDSKSFLLSFHFGILTFLRHPILTSKKDLTIGDGFIERFHALFQTI